MKTTLIVVLLIALAGGVAWWFRDSLPFGGDEPAVEVSQEAADLAEAKLDRLRDGRETVSLSGAELTSLLRFRNPSWASTPVEQPEVQMSGDTLWVSAIIPTDRIPSHPDLDRVRTLLPDSAEVEVEGSVRNLGDGRAALQVREVEFAGIPIPDRYYPPMLERLGRRDAAGLRPEEMALPLPPGVSEAYVQNGLLVLIP